MNKIRQLWAELPHQAQALIIAVSTAAGTAFVHGLTEGGCFSGTCLKHYAGAAVAAGLAAARAFYMLPNGAGKAALAAYLAQQKQQPPQPPQS